ESDGDRVVLRLDPLDGSERARVVLAGLSGEHVRVDPRGRWVVTYEGTRFVLREAHELRAVADFELPRDAVRSAGWTRTGRTLWLLDRGGLRFVRLPGGAIERVPLDGLRLYPWL